MTQQVTTEMTSCKGIALRRKCRHMIIRNARKAGTLSLIASVSLIFLEYFDLLILQCHQLPAPEKQPPIASHEIWQLVLMWYLLLICFQSLIKLWHYNQPRLRLSSFTHVLCEPLRLSMMVGQSSKSQSIFGFEQAHSPCICIRISTLRGNGCLWGWDG